MKLKKGEVKCDKCDGSGVLIKTKNTMVDLKHISYDMTYECPKCKGDGKLDWVEAVVGKGMTKQEKQNVEWKKLLGSGGLKITMGSGKYKKIIGK